MKITFGSNRRSNSRSNKKKSGSAKWFLFVFGLAFAAIGGVVFFFMFVLPMMNVQGAKTWIPVDATITHSEVEVHSSSDSTTYSIDIKYEYEYEGQTYTGDRYHFMTGSSSGRQSKQDVVDDHPVGENVKIYIDPNDPSNSVINREMTSDFWYGLIPLAFVLVGLGLAVGSLFVNSDRKKNREWKSEAKLSKDDDPTDNVATLKADSTALGKFIGMTIFAAIWNGGVWAVLIFVLLPEMGDSLFLSFPLIIVGLFALIGIGLLFGVLYQFLALFNPKPILEVSNASPSLGETFQLHWDIEGRSERIRELTITLEGEESARYQRGTDTVTDTHTFHTKELFKTDDNNLIMLGGDCDVTIPPNLMHSFDASNNKIIWKLKVHGDIKRWPDVDQSFNFVVSPMRLEGTYRG